MVLFDNPNLTVFTLCYTNERITLFADKNHQLYIIVTDWCIIDLILSRAKLSFLSWMKDLDVLMDYGNPEGNKYLTYMHTGQCRSACASHKMAQCFGCNNKLV